MAIVIGQGTQVLGTFFAGVCAISAQWGTNPNTQRMYCLGTTSAFATVEKPTQNLSVTVYSENGSGIDEVYVPASTGCDTQITVQAGISVAVCGSTVGDILYNDFMIQQFQFSKEEAQAPGQETWSLTRWMGPSEANNPNVVPPTYVIRGVTEGQATAPTEKLGVKFVTGTTTEGTSGSVQGNSIGKFFENVSGQVESVGGVTAGPGDTGNSSASMPLTPLWL